MAKGSRGGKGKKTTLIGHIELRGRNVEVHSKAPSGYVRVNGALTAPLGTEWYSNNKSRFGGERVSVLVRDADSKKSAKQIEKEYIEGRRKKQTYQQALMARDKRPQPRSLSGDRANRQMQRKLEAFLGR